ncbi:hypothetical protein Q9966_012781 [Columba livia]|nr:hypothetical protein Q9966_012781 [Columba livia]
MSIQDPGKMGDPFGRWSSSLARSEYDDSSAPRHPNNFSRPSGKSIYNQRKDYVQNLLKPQSDFQHHVEHLLTLRLERDLRSAEDCLARLKLLDAQGKVWGQNIILHIRDQDLVLRDVESKEELDVYPLGSVQGCSAALDTCSYDSVLTISVQERSPPGSSVLLFQCEQPGEILNHVLDELDLFVSRLKAALGLANTNVKKKKKKKGALPPQGDYVDFFQKVKYTLNLMGRTYQHVSEPTPPELLHLIFTALSFVLAHSPSPNLAREVEAPLLEPGAVELLERTLHPEHYGTWKTLGPAWNRSRAEYPNGEGVPPYTPVFSDGWLPPPVQQVLDPQKKWWLVQDRRGDKGYVPSNILEPLGHRGRGHSNSQLQESPPNLHPDSSPAEVTAWLKDKGFQRM